MLKLYMCHGPWPDFRLHIVHNLAESVNGFPRDLALILSLVRLTYDFALLCVIRTLEQHVCCPS